MNRLMIAMAALLPLASPSAFAQQTGGAYYNISDDPNSLQLLDLDHMGQVGGVVRLNVIDLYRGEDKFGLVTVWEIRCARQTLRIVESSMIAPGQKSTRAPITSGIIPANSTAHSRMMFSLACQGAGNLARSRVFVGNIGDIMRRFWSR